MTDSQKNPPGQADDPATGTASSAAEAHPPALDTAALMVGLLDKAATAQIALIQARGLGDRRGGDEALLQLRAATLLLGSIPAPDSNARRFAVLAAALLAAEDDDGTSYARLMVEHAIRLDDTDDWRVVSPVAGGAPSQN